MERSGREFSKVCAGTNKRKLRSELERLLSRVMVGDMRTLFRKLGLADFTRGKLDSYLCSCDDETLMKFRREIRNFLDANHEKVKSKGCPALKKIIQGENCTPKLHSEVNSESQVLNQDEGPCIPMSPRHASRAAMLKKRFAETIFKATHPEFDYKCQSSDSLCRQRARERLRKEKQQQESAIIEAENRAAKTNSRRLELDRERAAARMALEAMDRTVVIEENSGILKELEMLCRGSSSYLYYGGLSTNTLERVGLYLKNEYCGEEDEDLEEGEIVW